MKPLTTIVLSVLVTLSGLVQKRAFAIADLYKLKTIENPVFSLDGKRIAFTVKEDLLEQGKSNTKVYVRNSDGGNVCKLTENPAADAKPHWSMDGKSILFTSTRTGCSHAWLLPVDGDEARQLTSFAMGVDNLAWMPGAGYIVAFPNPHGSTGYGQEFTEAISKDWNGKVYQDVMAVADSLENPGGEPAPYDMTKMWRNLAYETK